MKSKLLSTSINASTVFSTNEIINKMTTFLALNICNVVLLSLAMITSHYLLIANLT